LFCGRSGRRDGRRGKNGLLRIHSVGTPLPVRPALMIMRAREQKVQKKSL